MRPDVGKHASYHFFRHSFAEYDLNGWDALRAVALAGKTGFTITRKKVTFQGDDRYMAIPVTPPDILNDTQK
jgi:site-specific recombinase XerC